MSMRINKPALTPLLAAVFAAAAVAAEDDRSGRTGTVGTVESFDESEAIIVIASDRYRMGSAELGPPPWVDEVAETPAPDRLLAPGTEVRFTVEEDSQYPPKIEHLWLAQ